MHKEDEGTPRLICEKQQRMALVSLNYPEKRNAIGSEMRAKLLANYRIWVENPDVYVILIVSEHPEFFSAGADLLEIYQASQSSYEEALAIFRDEYACIWEIECMTKPVISMINGKVMGGGIGISQFGTHIIAGENYSWSMPEVKIGLFPDVGVCQLLAAMPGALGLYLGLTGRAVNRDDARYLGLIEHSIDSTHFEHIKQQLRDAQPVDPLLDNLNQPAGESELQRMEPVITEIFSKATVEEIIQALKDITGEHSDWAMMTLAELKAASPTSLKVTMKAISRAHHKLLEEVLVQDFTLAAHFLKAHDFTAAIKSRMIEKNAPIWQPLEIEEVNEAAVNSYFSTIVQETLDLPPRELGIDK